MIDLTKWMKLGVAALALGVFGAVGVGCEDKPEDEAKDSMKDGADAMKKGAENASTQPSTQVGGPATQPGE